MMEPAEHKERNVIKDNFGDLKVMDQSEEDDIGLSRLKVIVRRQDSSIETVYIGKNN